MARPNRATDQAEEPREAVSPVAEVGQEAKQDIDEQAHPNLPLNGVFVVAEEVTELKGLLDLFEESFDIPTGFV